MTAPGPRRAGDHLLALGQRQALASRLGERQSLSTCDGGLRLHCPEVVKPVVAAMRSPNSQCDEPGCDDRTISPIASPVHAPTPQLRDPWLGSNIGHPEASLQHLLQNRDLFGSRDAHMCASAREAGLSCRLAAPARSACRRLDRDSVSLSPVADRPMHRPDARTGSGTERSGTSALTHDGGRAGTAEGCGERRRTRPARGSRGGEPGEECVCQLDGGGYAARTRQRRSALPSVEIERAPAGCRSKRAATHLLVSQPVRNPSRAQGRQGSGRVRR